MDAKAEKIALCRYGLIAPLVLETLPRGELTGRAEEIGRAQRRKLDAKVPPQGQKLTLPWNYQATLVITDVMLRHSVCGDTVTVFPPFADHQEELFISKSESIFPTPGTTGCGFWQTETGP
jgi:hypothetical protein